MTSALTGIILALFLSFSSLTVVLLRVSPLSSPEFALPFFFLCIFIAVAALTTLLLSLLKAFFTHQPLRSRKIMTSSLRQGMFAAAATCLILFLYLLHIFNWWIAILIYAVFVLIEMAVSR